MIQRCKNCGEWVKAEERNTINRALNPINEVFESEGGVMEKVGDLFGLKGLGRAMDRASRLPLDVVKGTADAVFGDKYHFECQNCGEKWSTDNELDDETEEYEKVLVIKKFVDRSMTLSNASEDEKIKFVNELLAFLPSVSGNDLRAMLFDTLAFSQFKLLGNVNEALNAISESLKL